jgi:hypothetical protein
MHVADTLYGTGCSLRRIPDRQQRLTGLFVVIGATLVFAPLVWLLQRWSETVARDPADAWGARWLGEHLSAHPYLMGAALLFGILISSGLVMLVVVLVAKRLAARLAGRGW